MYGCDNFLAGALKIEWMWALSRTPLSIGTGAWDTFKDEIYAKINAELPDYDPDENFHETVQTTVDGCKYTPV